LKWGEKPQECSGPSNAEPSLQSKLEWPACEIEEKRLHGLRVERKILKEAKKGVAGHWSSAGVFMVWETLEVIKVE